MTKAILFDAGGTLVHLDRRFVVQVLNEIGIPTDIEGYMRADLSARGEIIRIMRSKDPGTDTSRGAAYRARLLSELNCNDEAVKQVEAAMRAHSDAGQLWAYVEHGTREALAALKQAGYRLGVVSNSDGRVATFLENAGLMPYLELVVDSGRCGIEKPDPRIFHHALQQMSVDAANAVYVGDFYEIDVLGARAAGMDAVLIRHGESDPVWDCRVITSLDELLPQLMPV